MKIVFDLTPIYDHLTGIERYNINITKEIITRHTENQYILIFKNEVHNDFKELALLDYIDTIIIQACNKLFFIQYKLYRILQQLEADYYVFLSFTSPILFRKKKIINAIHDLTCWDCPETIPLKMKYYYRYTYKKAVDNSWKIVTVSKFSQKRICSKYNVDDSKVSLIYDGLTKIFEQDIIYNPKISKKYGLPNKYILSLSTLEPRKNLKLLIRAYKELLEENKEIPDLVLAGRKGWKLEEIVGGITDNIKNKIHFTGFVDDKDLPQLYADAEVFVFPSLYEGFGLPVIEAMSQRTIVISSDAASLPEVAGDAGILFKSNDINDLKKKICMFFNMDDTEKEKRKAKGVLISKKFSWLNEAEKLIKIMEDEYNKKEK